MSARAWSFAGVVQGWTHRSAPTRSERHPRTNRNWRKREGHGAGRSPPPTGGGGAGRCVQERRGVVTPPYGSATGGAQQWADVGIGPYAPRGDEGRHAGSSCPTGGCGEPPRLPWVAAHSGVSAPAGARDGWESRQRPSPKGASNAGQSLSHGEAVTAPVVPRAWPPSIKFQNGIWTSVTVPKILCSHTPTEF